MPTEKDEKDKKKMKDYDDLLIYLIDEVCEGCAKALQTINSSLSKTLDAKGEDDWEGVTEKYGPYSEYMHQLIEQNSGFVQIISLYIQTFSVYKVKPHLLPSVVHGTLGVLDNANMFYTMIQKHGEKLGSTDENDSLRIFVNKFSR